MLKISVSDGAPFPYGASVHDKTVNFCVFSRNATSVTIDLFAEEHSASPYFSYTFDPARNKTGDLWHVALTGLPEKALYLYRVDGPFDPSRGHRFNKNTYLIDPYAKALTCISLFANLPPDYVTPVDKTDILTGHLIDPANIPKCVVINDEFDWQGDRPLNYPLRKSIIYETHLSGFTAGTSSGVKHPGTYKGLIEKIPYLKELGVTSIEFLPVQEFDEKENTNVNPRTGERLENYWGYSTIAFFAPKASYAADKTPGGAVSEFKEMVREMHKAGLEVILDIVFNHTAEGNEHGITLSFRGFDNSIYYILEDSGRQFYANYSGCGNTVNCNHPVMRNFIIDCLHYWVTEMHVDGFRFDLGSILGRDGKGRLLENPPILERIAEDPLLRNTKIIAEAWDAGGAYQVGGFPGGRWAEWNDRFRDDVRKFWRGDDGMCSSFATRLTGSSDLYLRDGRKPFHSINYLTCHDGFTLNDLVSYNGKHNEDNGENNHDGSDSNCSYNYGIEGPSQNPKIEEIRSRQVKNCLFTMMVSQGTPMLLGGDEFRRTQNGNNNAYCQNNILSWFNWTNLETYSDIYRFTKMMAAFRRHHPAFMRPDFFQGENSPHFTLPDITWYTEEGNPPDWDKLNHFIAFRIIGTKAAIVADTDDADFFIMCNSSLKDKTVRLPQAPRGKKWYRTVDTSIPSPEDILEPGCEELLQVQTRYVLPSRSAALLISR